MTAFLFADFGSSGGADDGLPFGIRKFDHLEAGFWRAAVGTDPILRDVSPTRACAQAMLRQTHSLVIGKAATKTQPALVATARHDDLPHQVWRMYMRNRDFRAGHPPRSRLATGVYGGARRANRPACRSRPAPLAFPTSANP